MSRLGYDAAGSNEALGNIGRRQSGGLGAARAREAPLNPVPIHEIAERWIGKYERTRLRALSELRRHLEGEDNG